MVLETITLTEAEQQQLQRALSDVEGSPYGLSFDDFYSSVRGCERDVPARLKFAVNMFSFHNGAAGVLLLRGIPIDAPLRATPTIPYRDVTDKAIGTEKYLLLLSGMLGKPIGFADWHQGERVQNLYPILELQSVQCASNSVYLEMHTETAFRVFTPTHLALLCLKRDPQGKAKTVFCDLRAIVDSMDKHSQKILASPSFCFQLPPDGASERRFTEPKAIDTKQSGKRRLHYAEALTSVDSVSCEVLSELKDRIQANSIEIELEQGDLVLIDNFHITHGRTAFSPQFNGTDRWLQRVLIRNIPGEN
jgi:L-asparagine oxygenase